MHHETYCIAPKVTQYIIIGKYVRKILYKSLGGVLESIFYPKEEREGGNIERIKPLNIPLHYNIYEE